MSKMTAWRTACVSIVALLALNFLTLPARADGIRGLWTGTYWGEHSAALLAHFGERATVLPQPLDFGAPSPELVRAIITGDSPGLRALNTEAVA